jgi:AcrR family transcriptional regulator
VATKREHARPGILAAAVELIKERGARNATIDGVAKRAGCAKGLVHYHFKTKVGMLDAAANELVESRRKSWAEAFEAPGPKQAIDRSWTLLTQEAETGVIRAWASLLQAGVLPDARVRRAIAEFSGALGAATIQLMKRAGLEPTIPEAEIGWLLGAVVHGMGFQFSSGDGTTLEGAYAAAWLGILSLFSPRPS